MSPSLPRRILPLCVLLLAGLTACAFAGLDRQVDTLDGSGVRINVTGPVSEVPPGGAFTCLATVHNGSDAARTWNFRLQERASYERGDRIAATQSLRVEKDSVGTVALLLPLLTPSTSGYAYQSVSLHVEGYGTAAYDVSLTNSGSFGSAGTVFVAMGETLATPIWASLEKKYREDGSHQLNGSPLDARLLPTDWRGLAGFDCIWLTDGEYTALSADQRAALRRWVDTGGTLLFSTHALDPSLRAGLDLSESGEESRPGYGFVKILSWDGNALPLEDTVRVIDGVKSFRHNPADHNAAAWTMAKSLGKIPLNAPFLLPFIALFAVLAGPINLFVFAPASRRHRLFWTTPLISCAGSLVLLVVIVLQDGFGGKGERVMVTRLFPDQKQAVVTQEQVVRTGVLLSRHFQVSEDVLLTPLETPASAGRGFDVEGRAYGGDWFMSRLLQAHRAEAVLPSRAEVQLVNAAEVEKGAPPVVISSIPTTLREIYYRDAKQALWHGSNLHTGERMTLRKPDLTDTAVIDPSSRAVSHKLTPILMGLPVETGSLLLTQMQAVAVEEPNYFLAMADNGPFIETLSSVRWRKQLAVYLGPVTPVR